MFESDRTAFDIPDVDNMMPILHVSDVAIMTYLLQVCPSAIHHKRPKTGENLLHGSWQSLNSALTSKLLECCPTLLDEVSTVGESPLQFAFRLGAYQHVSAMLRFKPNLVNTDHDGNTVLHIAVQACCDYDVVLAVFQNCHKNLYSENKNGKTPFCLAVYNGRKKNRHDNVVEMLKPHITFDMALAARWQYYKIDRVDLSIYAIQQCNSLNDLILPDIADIVFEYLSVNKKRKRDTP